MRLLDPNGEERPKRQNPYGYALRSSQYLSFGTEEASLLQLPQDVHVAVLDLITSIRSVPPGDVTEELLAHLEWVCERASKVDGGYASWLGVAIAHAVHQRNAASSDVPAGQEMLQVAV